MLCCLKLATWLCTLLKYSVALDIRSSHGHTFGAAIQFESQIHMHVEKFRFCFDCCQNIVTSVVLVHSTVTGVALLYL